MYFPYYLWFINLFSFTHYDNQMCDKSIKLWSISRYRKRGTETFTAMYNYYTHNYEFAGKRYISYEDVINDALKV
jgi:hypothetical protein